MAFNKSKNVEAAQKLLNQGKVAQAIAEYQQILKYEPRDQVTLMTIGELYIRQGETFQAIDYFERLAQIFVGDGFLTKAIAVYKRIAKLAPEEIRPLEKLADLYVQQGVMSEARPLFLQLAEIHLKNNRQPEAISLLKKLLQAEPDNLRIQIRLADLYQAMGQTKDALDAYISASQRALARGDKAESEKLADKALKLEPNNLAALIVKARSYSSEGNAAKAAELLEDLPGLEKGGEQTEFLLDLYVKSSNWDKATALALRVFEADEKNFGPMQKTVEALLGAGQGEKAMAILEKSRIPMIDAGEHEVIGKLLNELAAGLPGHIEPLEWLVELYGRTSDSFRLPDALAHLGDALSTDGQLDRAKQIFEQLIDREPESDSAKRKLNHVLRKMGLISTEDEPEVPEENLQADIPKAPAPKLPSAEEEPAPEAPVKKVEVRGEPALDEETQKFIAQSLTDVDLFASYGLTQKAIGLLEAILRRAPRHTPTLEKLLDFVLGAGDDRRTAELAAQLEQIHQEGGDPRSSERFGELRRRFQRAAGLTDEELAKSAPGAKVGVTEAPAAGAHDITIPEVSAEPAPKPAAPVDEVKPAPVEASAAPPASAVKRPKDKQAEPKEEKEEVQEVDLSDEWATLLDESRGGEATVETSAAPPAKPSAKPTPPSAEPGAVEEFQIGEEPAFVSPEETPAAESNAFAEISAEISPADEAKKTPAPETRKKPAKAPEPEFELEQDFELVLDPEPLVPAYDQKPPETPIAPRQPEPVKQNAAPAPPAGSGFASDQFLADLANEIDGLDLDKLSPSFSGSMPGTPAQPPAARDSAPTAPVTTGPLKEVFDEFRAELGEMGAEEEDLETHYNLGIAFREMGLLEEAISEFQKVAKATDRGRPFPYVMQCCTLLGLAFMEKGQPGIAAIWYERALRTPGNDPESMLALRYDLGVAQETAGEQDAALKSFSQVYAMNIDYRDVAERIAALQKPTR